MPNSRRNITSAITKMQLILCLAAVMLLGSSCYRKDLYLRVDETSISIAIYDVRLDLLWGIDWETEWKYQWDETSADFGKIGYSKPDYVKGTIYTVDTYLQKRISSFNKIFSSSGGRVSLTAGSTYDMLFYNFGTEWTSFNQSDDYTAYTATTRRSSLTSWVRSRSENSFSDMPAGSKTYIDYNQPDELFGTLITDMEISDDPGDYEKEYDKDGNITYVYKVDANLRPYSFIYLFQVIILNNYDDVGKRITGGRGMTISGLSQGVELFTRMTFTNTVSLSTEDVKPMQPLTDLTLPDGSVVESADIFAARMLTWGLPGIVPLDINKAGAKAAEIDKNYIGLGLTLRNGATFTITRDITDAMHIKPTGGVITIYIDSSIIPDDAFEKKPQTDSGGFGAKVEDWGEEVNAEVEI